MLEYRSSFSFLLWFSLSCPVKFLANLGENTMLMAEVNNLLWKILGRDGLVSSVTSLLSSTLEKSSAVTST